MEIFENPYTITDSSGNLIGIAYNNEELEQILVDYFGNYGFYLSSLKYDFPNQIENNNEITIVGNNKKWEY